MFKFNHIFSIYFILNLQHVDFKIEKVLKQYSYEL